LLLGKAMSLKKVMRESKVEKAKINQNQPKTNISYHKRHHNC